MGYMLDTTGPPLVETSRVVRLLPPEPDGDDGPRHPPAGVVVRPAVHSPAVRGSVHRCSFAGSARDAPPGTVIACADPTVRDPACSW